MATVTTLGFNIFSRYDGNGLRQARRDLNDFDNETKKNTNSLNSWSGRIALMVQSALTLGPALIPIAAGLTAIGGGAVSAFGAAAGAAGVFGLGLKAAMQATIGTGTETKKLHDQLFNAKALLATMTPGTAAYAAELKKVNQLQSEYNKQLATLNPAQRQYIQSLDLLKSSWKAFGVAVASSTLPAASTVIRAIAASFDHLIPLVKAVAPLANQVAAAFKNWVNNGGLDATVKLLKDYGVPALHTLWGIAQNLVGVLGDGFRAFLPIGMKVLGVFADGAKKLSEWSSGGGFQRFVDYVMAHKDGLEKFFQALGGALKQVSIALADMGPRALTVTTVLLQIVAAMPPPVIEALAYAWIAWTLAMKGWAIIAPIVTSETFALAAAEVAAAWPIWLVVAAVVAVIAIFVALGIGIYELVTHWAGFTHAMETAWRDTWTVIKVVALAVWAFLTTQFQAFVSQFVNAWNTVSGALKTAWTAVWNALKVSAQVVWDALKTAWSAFINAMATTWTTVSNALKTAWSAVWNALKTAADAVWNSIKVAWAAFINAMATTWTTVSNALKAAWSAVWNAMKTAADAIWNAIKTAWTAFINAMKTTWDTVSNALKSSWSAVWNAMKTAGQTIWNAIKTAWDAFLNAIKTAWTTASNALKTAWSALWNALKTTAQTIWNAIKAAWTTFTNAMKTILTTMANALKTAWTALWNAMKTAAETVWNTIKTGFSNFAKGVEDVLSGLVSKAKEIWDKIVEIFKTPVNAVISIWDTVAGAVGLPKINKLATGGFVSGPGGPTDDRIPALLSNGEFVIPAASVQHYGVDTMEGIRHRRFAAGGIVGTIAPPAPVGPHQPGTQNTGSGASISNGANNVKGVVVGATESILNKLKGITANLVYDITKPLLDNIIKVIPHPVPGVAEPAGDVPWAAAKKLEEGILSKLKAAQDAAKAAAASQIGGKGTIPSAQHKAIIDQALAKAGVPQSQWPAWEAGLNTLITRESSWNPNAINLTDSNAKAGHPSQGLMQTIPSTFAAYSLGGSITDPVSNIVAGIRYIIARYGGIGNVQQANASAPPKGYAMGTGGAHEGWAMVGEQGPEMVHFRGGEKVINNHELRRSHHHNSHRGGDWHLSMPITVQGNMDTAAVEKLDRECVPKLKEMLVKGTGTRF